MVHQLSEDSSYQLIAFDQVEYSLRTLIPNLTYANHQYTTHLNAQKLQ